MEKINRRTALELMLGGLAGAVIGGCSQFVPPTLEPAKFKGLEKNPFYLGESTLVGERYHLIKIPKFKNSLGFALLPFNDGTLVTPYKKPRTLEFNHLYIPVEVDPRIEILWGGTKTRNIENASKRKIVIEPATAKVFDEQDSLKRFNPANNMNYSGVITENELNDNILVTELNKEDYYTSLVEPDKMNQDGRLNLYIIPVEGTEKLYQLGLANLGLRNREGKFYRPGKFNIEGNTYNGVDRKELKQFVAESSEENLSWPNNINLRVEPLIDGEPITRY